MKYCRIWGELNFGCDISTSSHLVTYGSSLAPHESCRYAQGPLYFGSGADNKCFCSGKDCKCWLNEGAKTSWLSLGKHLVKVEDQEMACDAWYHAGRKLRSPGWHLRDPLLEPRPPPRWQFCFSSERCDTSSVQLKTTRDINKNVRTSRCPAWTLTYVTYEPFYCIVLSQGRNLSDD